MKKYTQEEQAMIDNFSGVVVQCKTDYARDNKQATSKEGYGDNMTTAYTMYVIEDDNQAPSDYEPTIEYHSYGYESAMLHADMALYRKLMLQDHKFIKVLAKVKKHIKRKARAKANKNNVSTNGTTRRKAYKKRPIPTLPTK